LPFFYMLGAPVELMTKHLTAQEIVRVLAWQSAWAAITVIIALLVWRRGVRHFEAVGG
jgi:ABC-2 type transport system permease protein